MSFIGGHRERFDGLTLHRDRHEVLPDGRWDRSSEDGRDPFDARHRDLPVGVPDPHARSELRRVAAEPCVDVFLGGASLARSGTSDVRGCSRPVADHVLQRRRDQIGVVRSEHLLRSGADIVDHLAVAVREQNERICPPPDAAGGKCRVGVRHLERVHRLDPQRDRADRFELAPDTQQMRHVDDLLRPELRGDLREHGVDGMRGGRTKRERAGLGVRCIRQLPRRAVRVAVGVGDGDGPGSLPVRVQVVAVVHSRRERERLERGAGLAPRPTERLGPELHPRHGQVHLRFPEVAPSDHREDLPRARVDRDERGLGVRRARKMGVHGGLSRALQSQVERGGHPQAATEHPRLSVLVDQVPLREVHEVLGVRGSVQDLLLRVGEHLAPRETIRRGGVEVAVPHHLVERIIATDLRVCRVRDRIE